MFVLYYQSVFPNARTKRSKNFLFIFFLHPYSFISRGYKKKKEKKTFEHEVLRFTLEDFIPGFKSPRDKNFLIAKFHVRAYACLVHAQLCIPYLISRRIDVLARREPIDFPARLFDNTVFSRFFLKIGIGSATSTWLNPVSIFTFSRRARLFRARPYSIGPMFRDEHRSERLVSSRPRKYYVGSIV